MASSGNAAQFMKAFARMVWSVGGRLTLQKASAVHKGEFLDFFNFCARDMDFLQQVTIATSMRSHHMES